MFEIINNKHIRCLIATCLRILENENTVLKGTVTARPVF